ncbi:MAG: sigma factor, partial [Bacteroidota bacterium]
MKTQTLHQLRQQVPEAQKQLYYQHCDRLMAVIYRYTGNTADAEEVLQDSFIQIFEKIDLFDPSKGSFSAWSCR